MIKIAGLLLIVKLGIGLFAFELVDTPLLKLAQIAYLGLFVGFLHWTIVNGIDWGLRKIGQQPKLVPFQVDVDEDDDRIDQEWIEQMMASINTRSHPAEVSKAVEYKN